jgi:hypothetical protein
MPVKVKTAVESHECAFYRMGQAMGWVGGVQSHFLVRGKTRQVDCQSWRIYAGIERFAGCIGGGRRQLVWWCQLVSRLHFQDVGKVVSLGGLSRYRQKAYWNVFAEEGSQGGNGRWRYALFPFVTVMVVFPAGWP